MVLDLADELKIGVKSHSSSIEDPMADRVRRLADSRGLREEEPVEEPEPAPPAPVEAAPLDPAPVAAAPAPAADEPRPVMPHRVVRSTGGIPEPPPAAWSARPAASPNRCRCASRSRPASGGGRAPAACRATRGAAGT